MPPCCKSGSPEGSSDKEFQWSDNLKDILKSCKKLRITRHGESKFNAQGLIGGNAGLSPKGQKYATVLGEIINKTGIRDLQIWMSELIRTQQTAEFIEGTVTIHSDLNEINAGDHDSLSYEVIAEKFPNEFTARSLNKLTYRYPKGESYIDVCRRVERVLSRIDSEESLLIVSHQAVIRCILAAIQRVELKELPYIEVPLHTLIEVDFFEDDRPPKITYKPLPIDKEAEYKPTPKISPSVPIQTESAIAAH